jgi:flotillin
MRDAEADYAAREREAEANFFVTKRQAEAEYIKKEREAQAQLIAQQAEAQGLTAIAKACGEMANVLGGPAGLVSHQPVPIPISSTNVAPQMQYLMLTNGTYERLADANVHAIKGLQPKINVWNTGAQGVSAADPTAPIRNLFQSLPPLLSTIHDQTGMQLPSWLAQMPTNGENFDPKKIGMHLRNGSDVDSA